MRKGFTLIEALVIIAIVSILIALVGTSLSGVKEETGDNSESAYCKRVGRYTSVGDLPANCLKYYQTNQK